MSLGKRGKADVVVVKRNATVARLRRESDGMLDVIRVVVVE
jgi:hypothetical protein